MTYVQTKVHPCLYFALEDGSLIAMVAWFDDIIILGLPVIVEKAQQELEKAFTCKHEGPLNEYVGSKII